MLARVGWSLWAIIPVIALTLHFGPGQEGVRRDAAAREHRVAQRLEAVAAELQATAHQAQFATLEARGKALLSGDPNDQRQADVNLESEKAAYAEASDAWKAAADAYQEVEALLEGERAQQAKWAKARSLVRAGEIYNGIDELEAILAYTDETGQNDGELAIASREELAAAHYYGARILREEGRPPALWRESAGIARQQYRFLTERAAGQGQQSLSDELQHNLERVLDLEQLDRSGLVGTPFPKNSPRGRRPGDGDPGQRPGRTQAPRTGPPGNGASGLLEIGPGW